MSACPRSWRLLVFVAVLVAVTGIRVCAQDDTGERAIPAVTILPLANHSGYMTAVEHILPLITQNLSGMAADLRDADTTRQILRRHRIRAIGRIDRAGAHALARDLGVDYLLTGAIDVFAPGSVPEVGLSLRLVDAQSLQIVWAGSIGATGDDGVKVFGLGRVSSIAVLAERAVADLMKPLERALTGGPVSGPDIPEAVFDVLIVAADSALADSETVNITVVDTDDIAPELSLTPPPRITERSLLEYTVTARDRDRTVPHIDATGLPPDAVFFDHGDGRGTLTWTPGFTDAGAYTITFIASDGVRADSESVVVTVDEIGNQVPEVSVPDSAHVVEGAVLMLSVSGHDIDGTTPTLDASNLPRNATFVDNGDGTGVLEWTPGFAAAGTHRVVIYARDGISADSSVVTISVADAGNQPPALTVIGPMGTIESVPLRAAVSARDPDETIPVLRAHGIPDAAVFVDHGDGTGMISWSPGFGAAGAYPVSIVASDGALTDSQIVEIMVGEARNQAPVLAQIEPQSTTENEAFHVTVAAEDRDGTIPRLFVAGCPEGLSFVDHGDGSGTLTWTPGYADAGDYRLLVVASDGALADSIWISTTVRDAGNQAPALAGIAALRTAENVKLLFEAAATDPDETIPALYIVDQPETAVFADRGDGTATFEWTPDYTDAGVYDVTVIAADGTLADSQTVSLTVVDAGNQPPLLMVDDWYGTTENVPLSLTVSVSDPDATIPSLSAALLPAGANFIDNLDGTGAFVWTPDSTQVGVHRATFLAHDGKEVDSQTVEIGVVGADNRAPVLGPVAAPRTSERSELVLTVAANDPDGSVPRFSAIDLPAEATFHDSRSGTGTLMWTPGFTAAGTYPITLVASDGVLADSERIIITVDDIGNQAPIISAPPSQRVSEGAALTFSVSATDADAVIPEFSAANLPPGATFNDRGDGAGDFQWTPGYAAAGTYGIIVIASDGVSADTAIVDVTVDEAGNQSLELETVGPQGAMEDAVLRVDVSAIDPDGTIPILRANGLPVGAAFEDYGDGTGVITWNPRFTDAGVYNVTVVASDGVLADSEIVEVTIGEAGNQSPVLDDVGMLDARENVNLTVPIAASDPDMTAPHLYAIDIPAAASFVDQRDGTGVFEWTPGFTDAGMRHLLIVASDGVSADSEWVWITVADAGNQPPLLVVIDTLSVREGESFSVNVSAGDPDATIPQLYVVDAPEGVSVVDHGDGTGTLTWTPGFTDAGKHVVTVVASDGALADSQMVALTVVEAGNQPPVIDVGREYGTTEHVRLTFTIVAHDPDTTLPVLSGHALPPGAVFTDHADGTATFDWTPGTTDDLGRPRIALVPFDDLEPELHGGHIVADQILTQLVERGFIVIDPGTVHGLGLSFGRTPRGGVDYELLAALRDSLGCTAVITGVVDEWRLSSSQAEQSFPSMTVSCWLVDAKTGRILTFADVSRTGDREHFLGFGRIRSAVRLGRDVAATLLDKLGLDKESSIAAQ